MRKFMMLSLFAAGCLAVASGQDKGPAPPLSPVHLTVPAVALPAADTYRQILVYKAETRDSVEYGTDPEQDRWSEEQEREEKLKEERSWRMLENMNIYKKNSKKSTGQSTDKSQQ